MGWYPMLYISAGEEYLEIDRVVNSPASEFLYFMNFYKRKQELEMMRLETIRNSY